MELDDVPVTRLMTRGALTVAADATVRDAAGTLVEEGVGSLVVVDDADVPVGMFTTTDLAGFVSGGERGTDEAVSEHMSTEVTTVGTRESMRDAAARMITNGVHHLPVVDEDGHVVGMLSTMDLTGYLSYTDARDTD